MDSRTKISRDQFNRIEDHLDAPPDHDPVALTKREAIYRLMPRIDALRKRGYTVEAIARELTSTGLAVTRAVLQKYLSDLKTHSRMQSPEVPARGTTRSRSIPPANAPQVRLDRPAASDPSFGTGKSSAASRGTNASLPPSTTTIQKLPSRESVSHRASFIPREDTKDL
jgi:hypothetical protein